MTVITKITLSDKELSLVQNSDWILTKQIIIQKVYDLFAGNIDVIRSQILAETVLPQEINLSIPKINKGENYLKLPYVILDYPRFFDKENVFAVRTMFWWANFFSITLHVSGVYKELLRKSLYDNDSNIIEAFHIGVNEDQWHHHFGEDNYLPCSQLTQEQRIRLYEENHFVKLAVKFELGKWNDMPGLLEQGYSKVSQVLA